jgi:hypothetical protein
MRISRSAILIVLGGLTIFFLGSSYTLWFNDDLIPFGVGIGGGSPTPLAAATAGASADASESVRLTVRESGIVALTARQLHDAGLDFAELSSKELNLTKDGEDVPFLVRGENEDAILYFYARASNSPLEALSVSIMRPGNGQEMAQRSVQPDGPGSASGQHRFIWEENRFFVDYAYGEDIWMGPLLMASDTWTFLLDEILPSNGPAVLTIRLFSNAEGPGYPDHHAEILVNDQTVADHKWDGIKHETITAPLPAGLLSSDEVNTLSIVIHDDTGLASETVYVDDLELIYEGRISVAEGQATFVSDAENILIDNARQGLMVFDITDRQAPVHLTKLHIEDGMARFAGSNSARQYIALNQTESMQPTVEPAPAWTKSLRGTGWGADYIAIVADVRGFHEALEPLLAHRRAQGLRVADISLEQIYDEFGNGRRTPKAIKNFLAHTAVHWTPPAPTYVLLIGDATYDLTDQMPGKNRNRLPTALVHSDMGGYVASDSWYSRFDGDGPQMATGRFPAQNAPQLRAMVDKTIRYEESAATEDNSWRQRALLVADDEAPFDDATIDLAQDLAGRGYRVYRLQMSQSENIHYNILSVINQGVALVNYAGHGSKGAWGDEAVLQSSDAQALYNGARLPILTAMTSLNGAFAEPQIDSLAESLLRTNNGGIVAAIAPSGRANNYQMLPLAGAFYDQLLSGESERVGDALYHLMRTNASDPSSQDALVALNLLGDPALQFYAP